MKNLLMHHALVKQHTIWLSGFMALAREAQDFRAEHLSTQHFAQCKTVQASISDEWSSNLCARISRKRKFDQCLRQSIHCQIFLSVSHKVQQKSIYLFQSISSSPAPWSNRQKSDELKCIVLVSGQGKAIYYIMPHTVLGKINSLSSLSPCLCSV